MLIKISRVIKYDTTTIKSNERFFLCGIVLSLYIDSKIICAGKIVWKRKTSKTCASKKWKLHFRVKAVRVSLKVKWQINIWAKVLIIWCSSCHDSDIPTFWTASSTYLKWVDFVANLITWMTNFWKFCSNYILLPQIIKLYEKC